MSRPRASFVVIGLNEAKHLAGAIGACARQGFERGEIEIFYVDSGSTDDSIAVAREAGADHILELATPERNAARARNLGLQSVRADFVQFVDGDTSLAEGWAREGVAALEADPSLAGAEGHLEESQPGANLYHAVCELDWPSTPGEVAYVSGNSLYRVAAIREARGFDPHMHVGEEPELGARLRAQGWRFVHLDRVMAIHDLDMEGFGDWLRRGYKSGLACAMVVRATGGWATGYWHERLRQTLLQGAVLAAPWLLALLALPVSGGLFLVFGLVGLAMWGALVSRKARALARQGLPLRTRVAFALHTYAGKLPSSYGILSAYLRGLPAR